jgi:hypothetical protein
MIKKKFSQKIGVFYSKHCYIVQKMNHNIGFKEIRQFFRRKSAKIAKISCHNIDPRFRKLANLWRIQFDLLELRDEGQEEEVEGQRHQPFGNGATHV